MRPLASKHEYSKCFSNSRSTACWPPRFFSTVRIDPVAEALRLVRVELDVHLGDDVVLLVQDQDHVGFVVDGRRAAQVVVAQAGCLQAFLVGGDDARSSRTLMASATSLRPLTTVVTFSVSVSAAPG